MSLTGASASVVGSILLPCFCYLKIFGASLNLDFELVIIGFAVFMGLLILVVVMDSTKDLGEIGGDFIPEVEKHDDDCVNSGISPNVSRAQIEAYDAALALVRATIVRLTVDEVILHDELLQLFLHDELLQLFRAPNPNVNANTADADADADAHPHSNGDLLRLPTANANAADVHPHSNGDLSK